jgi:hypothetical protein
MKVSNKAKIIIVLTPEDIFKTGMINFILFPVKITK